MTVKTDPTRVDLMTKQVQHDEADDFFESIGLSTSCVSTPEDIFMDRMTDGSNPRIAVMRWWLKDEIIKYQYLLEENIKTSKNTLKDAKLQDIQITQLEYAKLMIKFYLQRYHLTNFNGAIKPVADMELVIEKLVDHPDVREVIEKKDYL